MTNNIFKVLAHALLAALGTMARQLHTKGKPALELVHFISGCLIAMFTGTMVYFLTSYMKLESNLSFAIAGISGWIGPQVLDGLAETIKRMTGISLKEDKPDKYEG